MGKRNLTLITSEEEGCLSYSLISIAGRRPWSNKEGCLISWPMTSSPIAQVTALLYNTALHIGWRMEKAKLETDKETGLLHTGPD